MSLTIREKKRVTKLIDDGYAKVSTDYDDIIEKDFMLNRPLFFDLVKPDTPIPNPAMNNRYQMNNYVHSRLNALADIVNEFASADDITVDDMYREIKKEVDRAVALLPVLPPKE